MREHLVECDECRQVVLDMESFEDDLLGAPEPKSESLDEQWTAFQERLQPPSLKTEGLAELPPRCDVPASAPRLERRKRPAAASPWAGQWALAATVMLSLGLGTLVTFQHSQLQESLQQSQAPRPNPIIVQLVPEGSPGLRGASSQVLPISPSVSGLMVILAAPDARPFPEYRAEIFRQGTDKPLYSVEGLQPQEGGLLQLFLPSLPAATYRFELFGLEEGEEKLLGTYPLRLEAHD
jgi:hypothetical protein